MPIFSKQNPLVKRYRQVRAGLDRRALFLEGVRLIEDTVRSDIEIESVIVARDLLSRPAVKNLMDRLTGKGARCEVTSWEILEYLSDVTTPQGILAIAQRKRRDLETVMRRIEGVPLLVIIDTCRDPGNLGTIMRSGEALGAHAIVTTPQTVDPYSAKVIRASMGSALRLPVIDQVSLSAALTLVQQGGLQILAGTTQGPLPLTEADFTRPTAILIGNEAYGLSEEALSMATEHVKIPMRCQTESLNVAMATTIFLYEAARQRKFVNLADKP